MQSWQLCNILKFWYTIIHNSYRELMECIGYLFCKLTFLLATGVYSQFDKGMCCLHGSDMLMLLKY